jgi:2-dehydropantoate 2-reductase
MTVHILGLGSIGIVSAYILRAAHPLLPIYYLPRQASTSSEAFTVHLPKSDSTAQLTDLVNDVNGRQTIEVFLITTKAHQAKSAISTYYERITKSTLMIFLHNGMGVVESMRNILPSQRIVLGTTLHGAYRTDKNHVHWVHKGETLFSPEPSTNLSSREYNILSAMGKMPEGT